MKADLRALSFGDVISLVTDPNLSFTYSQEGEDILLAEMFLDKGGRPGFYVDIGAHHPVRFSNTYAFYLHGWNGINIDAAPGSMEMFRQLRTRDINVEVGIGDADTQATFFMYDEPALNSFDPERVAYLDRVSTHRVRESRPVPIRRLADVLAEHCPAGQVIDFFNIDTEGWDMAVVASNDWQRFRPRVVVMEDHQSDLLSLADSASCRFMGERGYTPVAKLPRSLLFQDQARQSSA
jgi:FkbM family methyltransferase